MKILILFSQPWNVGGAETHVTDLVKGLVARDHKVYLAIHGSKKAEKLIGIAEEQWLFNFRSANILNYISVGNQIAGLVRAHNIDIVHAHQRTSGYIGAYIKRKTGVPFFVTIHDPWERAPFKKIHSKIFDNIITVSEFLRNRFIHTFGFADNKVHTVYNGVDQHRYNPSLYSEQVKANLRQELGLIMHHKVVSLIARLYASKGHQYLISAAPSIIKKVPNVKFLFVGSGEHESRFKEQIDGLGIPQYFVFAGYREDIPELISISDVVVRPSDMEGLPINLIEAMLMEKPVVATAIAGVPEMIVPGENGYMMAPGSSEELAAHICHILSKEEDSERMGLRGRETALQKFTLQGLINQVEQLYVVAVKGRLRNG